jgi:hypothetical protein
MKQLLPKLTARLQAFRKDAERLQVPRNRFVVPKDEDGQMIMHAWLWPRVGGFFREKDVVITETGTASFGILDVSLPDEARFMGQILWGSIGWTVGERNVITVCCVFFLLAYRKHAWRCVGCKRHWTRKNDFVHRRWQHVRVMWPGESPLNLLRSFLGSSQFKN